MAIISTCDVFFVLGSKEVAKSLRWCSEETVTKMVALAKIWGMDSEERLETSKLSHVVLYGGRVRRREERKGKKKGERTQRVVETGNGSVLGGC